MNKKLKKYTKLLVIVCIVLSLTGCTKQLKDKDNKLLKKQLREKDEVIHDLDKNNYRGKYELLKEENAELKKKLQEYENKYNLARISLEKDSSNSLKPSSTDGFKKVVQNNRVKSRKETRKRKRTPKVFTNSM